MSERPQHPQSDADLLASIEAGERGAFEAFYRRHSVWLATHGLIVPSGPHRAEIPAEIAQILGGARFPFTPDPSPRRGKRGDRLISGAVAGRGGGIVSARFALGRRIPGICMGVFASPRGPAFPIAGLLLAR